MKLTATLRPFTGQQEKPQKRITRAGDLSRAADACQ
jgi:hypothetical protein